MTPAKKETHAKKGDTVQIEYTGTFDDGTVFDSTEKHGGDPLQFTVGAGDVIPGFDSAVDGMKIGDEKDITIKSAEAYGDVDPKLQRRFPRAQLPEGVQAGMMLGLTMPDGRQIPAHVKEVTDKDVLIDLNHPLAGKTLHFHIKFVGFGTPGEHKCEHGCDHH